MVCSMTEPPPADSPAARIVSFSHLDCSVEVTLTDCDLRTVTSKEMNVSLNPLQGEGLVEYASIDHSFTIHFI